MSSVATRLAERAPVVPSVVRRHVEDAAFYWTQLDVSLDAPQLDANRAAHFGDLLCAHLEGIRVAGREAVALSLQALERWRKPGEAFVAFLAALQLEEGDRQVAIDAVLRQVKRRPDLLIRGAVSAVAWSDPKHSRYWLATISDASDPVDLVIALRGSALTQGSVGSLDRWLGHAHPAVRAAACRCAGPTQPAKLESLSGDEDLGVRAESAIAQARELDKVDVQRRLLIASRLWQCVSEQLEHCKKSTGWDRVQADRRLVRWIRHLAVLAPVGHPGMRELVVRLPSRAALTAMLHHGDLGLLDLVVRFMDDEAQQRWAGWVWQCLTGIDLEARGLVREEPPIDLDAPLTASRKDADLGLPLPDTARISAHSASLQARAQGQRVLRGLIVDEALLHRIIDPEYGAPQGLRFVAVNALNAARPDHGLNLRARPALQRLALCSLKSS
ncbi:MAG: hypothetical protein EOP37_21735 [Rubrivivax sp.]|nr:MAG: hypothetical protein EOP37_21735 [Rubrivivax sp.]